MHHDLKPENVLIDADGHCVIADYGSSKLLDDEGRLVLNVGDDVLATLSYAAPELLTCEGDADGLVYYDENIDWWSLGAIIMSMVIGEVSVLLSHADHAHRTSTPGILLLPKVPQGSERYQSGTWLHAGDCPHTTDTSRMHSRLPLERWRFRQAH